MPENKNILAIFGEWSSHFVAFGEWSNNNQGLLTIGIFLITIFLGWASGIFSALRHKPKFKLAILPGPSFCCTFLTGKTDGEYDTHRTGIALYLSVTNIGSAPSSLKRIVVGYHWNLKPLSWLWVKNRLGWFWLREQAVILSDFQVTIGENIKFYPFLTQRSAVSGLTSETYLEVGRSSGGVVYFEQSDSFGGCFPIACKGKTKLIVGVSDVSGKTHYKKFKVPVITLEEARLYNPSFGQTLAELHGEHYRMI